jgi:hypothetical protein
LSEKAPPIQVSKGHINRDQFEETEKALRDELKKVQENENYFEKIRNRMINDQLEMTRARSEQQQECMHQNHLVLEKHQDMKELERIRVINEAIAKYQSYRKWHLMEKTGTWRNRLTGRILKHSDCQKQ